MLTKCNTTQILVIVFYTFIQSDLQSIQIRVIKEQVGGGGGASCSRTPPGKFVDTVDPTQNLSVGIEHPSHASAHLAFPGGGGRGEAYRGSPPLLGQQHVIFP